jgi:hypothetical protein
MNLRTIPRLAINGYLTAVKLPVDAVARRFGRRNGATTSGPEIFVDRVDAGVRDAVGRVTLDPALRQDAAQRRTAADERERALSLRESAQERKAEADQKLNDKQSQAEKQRQQAEKRAEQQRQQADKRREEKKQQAAKAEQQRKDASRKAKAKVDAMNEDRERKERLKVLEEKSEALEEKDEALTASDESKRLAEAAANAKAARKAD